MKKYIGIAIIIGVMFAGGVYGVKKYATQAPKQTIPAVQSITAVLNTGEEISTASGVQVTNAFEALTAIAKQKSFDVKTKQYDFGVFVEQVGDFANTKEKSWVYIVNGKSGEVAADKYQVRQGDVVEWKYTTPLY